MIFPCYRNILRWCEVRETGRNAGATPELNEGRRRDVKLSAGFLGQDVGPARVSFHRTQLTRHFAPQKSRENSAYITSLAA